MLKTAAGAVLILISFIALSMSGTLLGSSLPLIFKPAQILWKVPIIGLFLGAAGAGSLWGGLKLCGDNSSEAAPVSPGTVLGFGLLFPGSAQAYAGRWPVMLFFLLLPWILIMSGIAVAVIGGLLGGIQLVSPELMKFFMNRLFVGVLWIASIAEGWAWAKRQGGASLSVPRWRACVASLGAILFLLVPFLMLSTLMIGFALKARQAFGP